MQENKTQHWLGQGKLERKKAYASIVPGLPFSFPPISLLCQIDSRTQEHMTPAADSHGRQTHLAFFLQT